MTKNTTKNTTAYVVFFRSRDGDAFPVSAFADEEQAREEALSNAVEQALSDAAWSAENGDQEGWEEAWDHVFRLGEEHAAGRNSFCGASDDEESWEEAGYVEVASVPWCPPLFPGNGW